MNNTYGAAFASALSDIQLKILKITSPLTYYLLGLALVFLENIKLTSHSIDIRTLGKVKVNRTNM